MKAKNSISTTKLCLAKASDPNPIHFSEARKKPGVYKLQSWAGSAVIVVMKSGKIFHVNDNAVDDNFWQEYSDRIVWMTDLEVPDEITK